MAASCTIDVDPTRLQAILIKVTETLGHELGRPTAAAPDWSDLDWRVARAVAAMHGVSSLLKRHLHWRGPAEWMSFLEEQAAHVRARHARIELLLTQIDQGAREQGLALIALKGAALHALGLYARGDRPMADVDLLVRPEDAEPGVRLIEGLAFRECRASWRERAFAPLESHVAGPLGEHSDNDITIELHERICEKLPLRITDITKFILPSQLSVGLTGYPSRAALMAHLLLHAAGAMAVKTLRLVQLHDLALLAGQMREADWEELLGGHSIEQWLWWAWPPLALTLRYYPLTIPERNRRTLESHCPWHLRHAARRRTLSDVSLSRLWVDAFPGLEWSRSIREALGYLGSRVWPTAQHMAEREVCAATQDWAASSSWPTLSQAQRIVRWVASRQARPPTLHVLRAALEQVDPR